MFRSDVFLTRVSCARCRSSAEGGQSTTRVNFEVNSGTENLFEIASASGRVVTTGNLEDITAFTGEHLNVSGSTTVLGAGKIQRL